MTTTEAQNRPGRPRPPTRRAQGSRPWGSRRRALAALGLAATALAAPTTPAAAQHSPYAGLEEREIKALSAEEVAGFLDGSGMGFALPAELHGYPGPKHVLELADDLALTAGQRAATERLFADMQAGAQRLGAEIVERERELDRRFAGGGIAAGELTALTVDIGRLGGELRAVHLAAHLEMVEVLTPEQRQRYQELRGYHGGAAEGVPGEGGPGAGGHDHGGYGGRGGHGGQDGSGRPPAEAAEGPGGGR